MKTNVMDMQGKKVREVELPSAIFEAPINIDLMHQAYVYQMANARLGTHATKTRGEVSGGGKKPWAQKGTGRARQGSTRAPQWVGGGKVHTPHPHSHDRKMPLKMRHGALRSALSARASESAVIVVEEFKLKDHKSSGLQDSLQKLVGAATVLLVLPSKEGKEAVFKASQNNPYLKVLLVNYLNIRDLLSYDRLLIELSSLDVIRRQIGKTEKK